MDLITDHLNIWTTAQAQKATGRGKSTKIQSIYGIKKLRALILELAIHGKLVPQNSDDEPASMLLQKITNEKAHLVKAGKIKKQKPLPEIKEDEKPFELPEGWKFVRLGEITNRIGSGSTPRGGKNAYTESGIPFLRSQNIWNHGLELRGVARIPAETHQKMSNTIVYPNDVLLNITGASLGRCAIYPDQLGEANVSQHVTIIRPTNPETTKYLHLCILSPYIQSLVWGRQVGMAREGLSKKVLELFEVQIPPLAEQHRIVAKVNELMTLCDQLEQQQTNNNATHQTLVKTLLATLTHPTTGADETDTNAIEIFFQHFNTLFTTEQSIDQLKQTILQLAVMGKLVPQDLLEEPASSLVRKIADEKARLVKEECLKTKAKVEIESSEEYINKQAGWEYCRLGNLAKFIDYRGRTPKKIDSGVPLITAKNVRLGLISRSPREFISEDEYLTWMTRGYPRIGDILFTTEAPLGNVAIVDIQEKFALAQRVICFQLHSPETAPFMEILMMSLPFQEQIFDQATGMTATGIKSAKLKEIPVPIPPLAEQYRIVAKVNELLTLSAALKSGIAETRTTQNLLADASVDQAVA